MKIVSCLHNGNVIFTSFSRDMLHEPKNKSIQICNKQLQICKLISASYFLCSMQPECYAQIYNAATCQS